MHESKDCIVALVKNSRSNHQTSLTRVIKDHLRVNFINTVTNANALGLNKYSVVFHMSPKFFHKRYSSIIIIVAVRDDV